jgi:N-acetylneuraminic acid mutarotase
VGDKQYYSDAWVFDVTNRSWSQLEVCGQQPQGRFSHTAVFMNTEIAIYGGYVCRQEQIKHPEWIKFVFENDTL